MKQIIRSFHSEKQEQLITCNPGTKTIVAPCGRNFGKTYAFLISAFEYAWNSPGVGVYYIAPVLDQCKSAITLFETVVSPACNMSEYVRRIYQNNQRVEICLKNKKSIIFKSGDNPGGLRSNNLVSAIYYEECGEMDDDVRAVTKTNTMRYDKMSYGNYKFYWGTPKGFNFFYDLGIEAQKAENACEYTYRHFTTFDNPMHTKEFVDKLFKQYVDEKGYSWARQEIYAEFNALENTVFRNLEKCIVDVEIIDKDIIRTRRTSMGIDIAIKKDETAIVVIDIDTREVLYTTTYLKTEWNQQMEEMVRLWSEYNHPEIYIDATNESYFATTLDDYAINKKCTGFYLVPTRINQKIKADMVSKAAEIVSRSLCKIPRTEDGMKLVSQMNTFERQTTKSGNTRIRAYGRNKDDLVMSFMLALTPVNINYDKGEAPSPEDITTYPEFEYYRKGGY